MAENKVVYGLKNCHYSVITEDETGGHILWHTCCVERRSEISLIQGGKHPTFMQMIFFITQLFQMQDMRRL